MRRRTEPKTRKRMSAEDRKRGILETTISFISQFGFWGFTIRDVAQAQNITEAGLLYYYRTKEQLLEETLKYADRVNQIAIAEHLGVEGVTGEVLQDGIAYHCDLGLKAITTGTVETNADRPEMVRLYILLESEALSKDHPVHEYFEQREDNLLKEYATAAARDGVDDPDRTAMQVLSAMEGLQLRWLNDSRDVDFVGEWKTLVDLLIP
ncbi:TetR family transcriptional regulator [Bifidobacterium sp. 64T4]|uniref:TetR/AcrR family transcriptional regulator n=1 Tax=Bifidobacterium pongonis TaxID=2834432 RepID=UPI001C5807AC|nr:TetR/AcrR family transcriptional regulator [Bifidobacterium pongonis]MBW3094348.1 TetR family transcriptional regulator [Bifidobacterium pongonis]